VYGNFDVGNIGGETIGRTVYTDIEFFAPYVSDSSKHLDTSLNAATLISKVSKYLIKMSLLERHASRNCRGIDEYLVLLPVEINVTIVLFLDVSFGV
jgi:hypothetical protein